VPVQVYLGRAEQERLERLAERLDLTKSDVLRKGLEALDRQVTDPALHPVFQIIGSAATGRDDGDLGYSVAREHDRYLTETLEAEIGASHARDKRTGRRRGR
jgi:hypothetical protein